MTHPVLQEAVEAAKEALVNVAMSETDDDLSWTDCTEFTATSIEGNTALIARTAVEAAWDIFDAHLIEKLVQSYLDNRTAGIQEGRRIAAQVVEKAFTHPALNGTQHWDSDTHPVPDWIRITAINAALGTEETT